MKPLPTLNKRFSGLAFLYVVSAEQGLAAFLPELKVKFVKLF
jgi:hypothetical protein